MFLVRDLVSPRTWLAMISHLAGLFMGLAVLVVLVTGLSLGFSLLVLALGVAVLGTLFVTLDQPGVLGLRDAFALILLVQVAIVGLIAVMARALPDPR